MFKRTTNNFFAFMLAVIFSMILMPVLLASANGTDYTSVLMSEPTTAPTASPEVTSAPTTSPEASPTMPAATMVPLTEYIDMLAADIDVGEKDESYTGDINIYTTYGTLPTLYGLLNVYKDIDDAAKENRDPAKSYMWYLRGNTANADELPENVTVMAPLSKDQFYHAEYAKKFMAYARKLYETYPNAHFNLYCDDLRAQAELLYFTFNGIPEEQYNVHLLSDGTGSYSFIKNYFYSDSNPENVGTVENAQNKWELYEYWYNTYKERAEKGEIDTARFLDNNMGACYIMYAAAARDNVEYVLQWPELMISDDVTINEYLDTKMNRIKQFPSDIYAELSDEQKSAFLNAVLSASNLTQKEFDETYLPGINEGKKYMIISGTSPSGEGSISFEDRVNNVIGYFGDEYTYLYKPHPSWPGSTVEGRAEYLASKGIVEMPAQTPMEVILTAYPSVDLGGYNSSLYMSATGSHVKFFFTGSYDSLSAPLPDLYKLGMYPDAVLFNPEAIVAEIKYNSEDGSVTVENLHNDNVLIAAEFDGESFVSAKIYDVTSEANTVSIENDFADNSTVKLMLWNSSDNMVPTADSMTVTK